jgi:hypothetical protein
MDTAEKIKPRNLVVGGRYLNCNGLFIREIEAIEGKNILCHDQYSSWSCSNRAFVQACPMVATPAGEARVAEEFARWRAEGESAGGRTIQLKGKSG